MKYVYGFLLFYVVDLGVLYSRTMEFVLSAQELLFLGTINVFLWVSFEKFWKTYEKHQKELDRGLE